MLIAIPLWDTLQNRRSEITEIVIPQLLKTITDKDRVVVSDNGSCERTLDFLASIDDPRFKYILNGKNLGIAGATNVVWKDTCPGKVVCKMDNDCFIHDAGWTELVEYCLLKADNIGIIGLKRKDVAECPDALEPYYRSKLYYLPHVAGERWVVVEEVNHVIGTCYCFGPRARARFGYLAQPDTVYGFDDALASVRMHKLGYKTCFLPQINIDHLDLDGDVASDPYTRWKQIQASDGMSRYRDLVDRINSGKVDPYYGV